MGHSLLQPIDYQPWCVVEEKAFSGTLTFDWSHVYMYEHAVWMLAWGRKQNNVTFY